MSTVIAPTEPVSKERQRLLDSFEVQNFRVFQHLVLEKLGHVNLIVGKNNVGKSCLLEALYLYAERGTPAAILRVLNERHERIARSPRSIGEDTEVLTVIKHLFYGRKDIQERPAPISIGSSANRTETLALEIGWYLRQPGPDGTSRYIEASSQPALFEEEVTASVPRLLIRLGQNDRQAVPLYLDFFRHWSIEPNRSVDAIPNVLLSADGLTSAQMSSLWNDITLTPLERDVVRILQIVEPDVEAVNIVGSDRPSTRATKIRLANHEEPLSLRSLGEGINRMFGVALALVSAKNGLLLIDEIDRGLHYSMQFAMWRLIFQTAQRLNIQVFATTHSWDCIEAFQKAACENEEQEGMLIRLQRKDDDIRATLFDERRLTIATRDHIEIR